MTIEKKSLVDKLELLFKKYKNNIEVFGKDLADAITFLSVYCRDENIECITIYLKMFGFKSPKILSNYYNKNNDTTKFVKELHEKAIQYLVQSYDKTYKLKIILSKKYFFMEKNNVSTNNYYSVEYIFDENTVFVRNAVQNSCPLGKVLNFKECSRGNLNRGVCFCKITESSDKMETNIFKLLTSKGEEMYYSYFSSPDLSFLVKAPKRITTIPSITSLGMKDLNQLLEQQFNEDFVKFNDQKFFKNLKNIAENIFEEMNKNKK